MPRRPRALQQPTRSAKVLDPVEYTPFFGYRRAPRASGDPNLLRLCCESTELEAVAKAAGTPSYVYSQASIAAAYRRLDGAFASLPHGLCYAVKANPNLAVLRLLARLGSRFDVVSGGELDRLRRIGVPGARIVFSGVGKTRREIRAALDYPAGSTRGKGRCGILLFNVESEDELELLIEESARHLRRGGSQPGVAIRVNPDVLAGAHPHISTGYRQHKFGLAWAAARKLYLTHKNSRWIAWRGISAHIGSQILTVQPYREALARLASYWRELASAGVSLELLDIGGGLGIQYAAERALDFRTYARELARIARPLGCRLLVEPGRAIVGPAGVLLTRVLYVKENRGKRFVVVDAAMNDLIRPALYSAIHPVTKAERTPHPQPAQPVEVVGPICETGDFLARHWPLEPVKAADLLVVWAAGAYGFAQSSNYNSRTRAAEVLVSANRFQIVRRRETYDDLVRTERKPRP